MKPGANNTRGIGITLRTALWSWVITLVTLLVFAAAIVPQQKKTFQENLESKAHGIAVSLRDIAATAVVNEDFSTVVDHCKELLNGDATLDYLVVTKNDGFALISERSAWRAEPQIGLEWRPAKRTTTCGIGVVPMFNRRVFYYSQPFDYSGIQWGWIHVGLSLQSYDRSVASVYHRTGILAVICVVLGLLASGFYARQLVRPILSLRNAVQRVAGGDLSSRAEIHRTDELGTLATSINSMTEALLRRDRILESVRFAAQQFLSTSDWNNVIVAVLEKLAKAADASRSYVFENTREPAGTLLAIERHAWQKEPACPRIESGQPAMRHYLRDGFGEWAQELEAGQIVSGRVAEMPPAQRAFLAARGICSLIVIPIHVEGIWWGFFGFDDCAQARSWNDSERDSLRAAADMLGSAIARQRTQQALIEARDTLEARVRDRTQELQEQVLAKDRARLQLAEAQQQLIDTSRQAGMAEVATGVLHNVGNVLNSVNVSVNVINDRLKRSRVDGLRRVSELLQSHRADLGAFFTHDPKSPRVVELIAHLTDSLEQEKNQFAGELRSLLRNIEHIKEIVAMQQNYARIAGVTEDLGVTEMIEDALRLNEAAMLREQITIKREFAPVPPVRVDKHKVLQILINLFRNARQAMSAASKPDKLLTVKVLNADGGRVQIAVRDNGIGIAPENLTRIFGHGFTTKKDGHGFGLHSGALAAREMGGSLQVFSEGPGAGAVFTLELPMALSNKTQNQKSTS